MNKLYELIQQLCPDGVKYKKFGNVCQYIRGITYSKPQEVKDNSTNAWKVMRANNITLGSNVINFEDVKLVKREVYVRDNQLLKKGDILICAGSGSKEHIGKVAYIFDDMEYTFGGFMAVIRCGNELNSRFLFHILTGNSFSVYLSQALNSTTINNLNAGIMKNYLIPVPPLEVQQEIVRILDHFTELTAELTEKLTAELTAREKQYQYYRCQLLTFNSSVPRRTLSEVCNILSGGDAPKNEMSKEKTEHHKIPIISNGVEGNDIYGYTNIKKIETPAVTIAARGTIGYAAYRDYPYFPIIRLLSAIPKDTSLLDTKFLYYCLRDKQYNIPQSGIPQLTSPQLKKVEIFLPPLPEQHRIVSILDRFDAMCNDLTSGLPAEIAARQKQYEYYRDKLLTFKEKL